MLCSLSVLEPQARHDLTKSGYGGDRSFKWPILDKEKNIPLPEILFEQYDCKRGIQGREDERDSGEGSPGFPFNQPRVHLLLLLSTAMQVFHGSFP